MSSGREIIDLPFHHAIAVALRRGMKGDFLVELNKTPGPLWTWPEASLIMYGSSSMHNLHYRGYEFPFPGIKVSDIDLMVRIKGGYYDESHEKIYQENIARVLKHIVLQCDFDYSYTDRSGKPNEIWEHGHIKDLNTEEYFGREFEVYRIFSPEDVRLNRLSHRRDKLDLMKIIEEEGLQNKDIKVRLTISPNIPDRMNLSLPVSMLLKPTPSNDPTADGVIPVFEASIEDLVSGKLQRLITPGAKFKPADLLDIYNITYARPKILDLNPESPNNHLDILRLMVVVKMAGAGIKDSFKKDSPLLAKLQDNEQNRKNFIDLARMEIAANRFEEFAGRTEEIFKRTSELVSNIFRVRPGRGAHGPLNLTDNEVRFTTEIFGNNTKEILETPKPLTWMEWALGGNGKKLTKIELLPDYKIAPEHLKKEFPQLFKQYPDLSDNIRNDPNIVDEMRKARERDIMRIEGCRKY